MILRMMAVGPTHDLFRGAEDTSNIVDRNAKLQQHRRAGVPQDVWCHLRSEPRELACSPPSSALLSYRLARVFDDVGCSQAAPASGRISAESSTALVRDNARLIVFTRVEIESLASTDDFSRLIQHKIAQIVLRAMG